MEKANEHQNSDYYKFIYNFHKEMVDNGFNLIYEGEITHQITKAFTSLAENNMEKEMEDANVKKRVFHVMVECLQNICKHADDEYKSNYVIGSGIFIVGKYDEEYHIITGNKILNEKLEWMDSFLSKINSLDKDGLKQLYKKTMREGRLSEKGGAGLGFIDIARKTGNKLDFHFEKVNDKVSFFLLKTKISRY